ncbi:LysR family nitrogen assimilation transcriptional regulator [Streptomyces aurantiacus]|uniref:LysR family transcriptional regulator n=1 Tax=Streptomyces aurantiacus TaxID=47760 RepID=UPI002793FED6|nr:LysR substrate-binding domain-containing protein [Streptomyces aurantiacus]MDQ0779253.1 LysR family nitrogen assimilation transcriptional regulator [Streptomyces aurantiacus]
MDLKQLRAVVTVTEVGSVTRAAELLHLVQPAVTRQIRTLEQELGVDLFVRTAQGMRPTEAGTVIADRARRALNELDRARAEVQPPPGEVAGVVTVGLLESTSDLLAERLVTAVARDHPGVELRLTIAYSGHLQQWLDDRELDLALLYDLESAPSLHARPLLRERLWAVAPAAAGLRPDRPVPFARAAGHPLVLPASGHVLRRLIDATAARTATAMDVVAQTNSMRVQKQLVRAGHGWTVLPGVGITDDLTRGELSAAPLSEPGVWRSIALGTARYGRTPPAVRTVARELTHQVRTAVARGEWPSARLADAGRTTETA